MKGVKGRPRDERRLMSDPEMFYCLVRIHEKNTLFDEPMLAK